MPTFQVHSPPLYSISHSADMCMLVHSIYVMYWTYHFELNESSRDRSLTVDQHPWVTSSSDHWQMVVFEQRSLCVNYRSNACDVASIVL